MLVTEIECPCIASSDSEENKTGYNSLSSFLAVVRIFKRSLYVHEAKEKSSRLIIILGNNPVLSSLSFSSAFLRCWRLTPLSCEHHASPLPLIYMPSPFLLFLKYLFFCFKLCVCICGYMYMLAIGRKTRKGGQIPGVTGVRELLDLGAGNELRSSARMVHAHWDVSTHTTITTIMISFEIGSRYVALAELTL